MKKLKLLLVLASFFLFTKGFGLSGRENANVTEKGNSVEELNINGNQNCFCRKNFPVVEKAYEDLSEYDVYWVEKPVVCENMEKVTIFKELIKTVFIKGRLDQENITGGDRVWILVHPSLNK